MVQTGSGIKTGSRTVKIEKSLNLFANLRPAYLYEELKEACPLRDDIIGDGFDMMIMRELTGGLYFGARKTEMLMV